MPHVPHVIVYYRGLPTKHINNLKPWLANIVAFALSSKDNLTDFPQEEWNIEVPAKEVMVTEYAAKAGDTNVPPLAIHINAGEKRERDDNKVLRHIAIKLHIEQRWIMDFCPFGDVEIVIMFHGENGFAKMKDFGLS